MSTQWNPPRTKVQLRLGIQRLRTLQEKKLAQAKATRRELATLVEKGRIETARVKTEGLIADDVYTELLEILELQCELLLARFGLLDTSAREPDPGVREAVCSIINAAPRTELKELHVLRDMLAHRYGREFALAAMENKDECVSPRVTAKLTYTRPPDALVDAYLVEIAKGYGIDWSPPMPEEEGTAVDERKEKSSEEAAAAKADETAESVQTQAQAGPSVPVDPPAYEKEEAEDDFTALTRRFDALKTRKK